MSRKVQQAMEQADKTGFRDNPEIIRAVPSNDDPTVYTVQSFLCDIDRVREILGNLPKLRRYGGDGEALKEASEILDHLREDLYKVSQKVRSDLTFDHNKFWRFSS